MASSTRTEKDSLGELQVPAEALYGAQTQRAVQNFPVSGLRMPREFIRALGLVKAAGAEANAGLGHLPKGVAAAIRGAALQVAAGDLDGQFPVDVFQTGSGTSSNMNANEVIAMLASRGLKKPVHGNDQVNMGQSSNDVIPTAIQVAAVLACRERLLPALKHLRGTIDRRARGLGKVVKTGRTHLMDAMPLTLAQELGAWSAQLASASERIEDSLGRLRRLPIGGTAVGTGINADPRFGRRVAASLSTLSGVRFQQAGNLFEGIAAQDGAVELSGQLNVLAVALMKIGNDLRWMNSGPLAGLGEIELPALQPGSSIMPGKVNPVIAESLLMVCAQVQGNDLAVSLGGQWGNFELNAMLPLIARNLLESIHLLANGATNFARACVAGITANPERCEGLVEQSLAMVTVLAPVLGYDRAAQIAKQAHEQGRTVRQVLLDEKVLPPEGVERLLNPRPMTEPGTGEIGSKP